MAAIDEWIDKIDDIELKNRIKNEIKKITKQKNFGLVFEEHVPECTPMYDVPIYIGAKVAKKGEIKESFRVLKIENEIAECQSQITKKIVKLRIKEIITVAEFGEAIYPYLDKIDEVCNAPDNELWHTLIEADNYHALQLLEYLYRGKVDCIYIDPPYNSGAKDWKYNNNYVDENDLYRHSKWLAFMKRRLKLAKELMNPNNSTLLVTIDEKEYAKLAMLLEEIFPKANIQMVSITINPSGAVRENMFARADEYMFIVLLGDAHVIQKKGIGEETEVRWWYLRRLEYASRRGTTKGGVAQFYPIYIDNATKKIIKIGEPLTPDVDRSTVEKVNGATAVFPVRDDGVEMNWGVTGSTLKHLMEENVVRVLENKKSPYMPYTIKYLSENYTEKIASGRWAVRGVREDGSKIVVETGGKVQRATTVWKDKKYDAKTNGTVILKNLIGNDLFSFPKSLYSVHDALNYFVADNKNALILDFFAGSGTTLNAVTLLNKEDGGNRRCILVTNNELSASEEKILSKKGYKPGDDEWEKLGIARHVTWPRIVAAITGKNKNNEELTGNYQLNDMEYVEKNRAIKKIAFKRYDDNILAWKKDIAQFFRDENGLRPCAQKDIKEDTGYFLSEKCALSLLLDVSSFEQWVEELKEFNNVKELGIFTEDKKEFLKFKKILQESVGKYKIYEEKKLPFSEGFSTNANFFKLRFLDKLSVSLGTQLKKLIPLLWMKAGSIGKCPTIGCVPNDMIIFEYNKFAILINPSAYNNFAEEANGKDIRTVYIVTDYEPEYRLLSQQMVGVNTYQLYRDYIDNFRINHREV